MRFPGFIPFLMDMENRHPRTAQFGELRSMNMKPCFSPGLLELVLAQDLTPSLPFRPGLLIEIGPCEDMRQRNCHESGMDTEVRVLASTRFQQTGEEHGSYSAAKLAECALRDVGFSISHKEGDEAWKRHRKQRSVLRRRRSRNGRDPRDQGQD